MNLEIFLNDFAIRSFRDVADYDYIAARMAYRARLVPQFLWSGLQAIEKYLKCILLLNRIEAKRVYHDLAAALDLVKRHAPFQLRLQEPSLKLIEHLDTYGRFRYLETPFHVMGLEIAQLDMAVWDFRRYCRPLNYDIRLLGGEKKCMLDVELRAIEKSEMVAPHRFRIIGGTLEKILAEKRHPARAPLIWQNLFFGSRARKNIRLRRYIHSTMSPLSMRPEILDEVLRFVHLPKQVIHGYREEIKRRSQDKK